MPGTLMNVAAKSVAGPDSAVARAVERYAPAGETNLNEVERVLSLGVGSALVLNGAFGPRLNLLSFLLGGGLVYRAVTGHCHLYGALGVNTAAGTAPATVIPARHGQKVEHAVTVAAPPAEVYRFWRQLDLLPEFMDHLVSVKEIDATRSTWTAKGPLGTTVTWDAEVVTDEPGRVLSWRSLPGGDVDTAGSVHFTPAGGGTEVRVSLKFDPPGGKVGAAVARLFGENPDQQVRDDLAKFKQVFESGRPAARS